MPLDTQSLEDQFENASGIKLGRTLAEGNGTIYEIKGQPTKVVKVVFGGSKEYTNKMMRLLKKLKRAKSPAVVGIYQYGQFITDGESCYYYIMDKLRPLGGNRWDTGDMILAYLEGDPVPSSESSRVRSFVKKARKLEQKHHYGDVHGGNIMVTKRGALKFVDLESFTYN
jgi:D-alanyl-D-alanine carboxypeptidase